MSTSAGDNYLKRQRLLFSITLLLLLALVVFNVYHFLNEDANKEDVRWKTLSLHEPRWVPVETRSAGDNLDFYRGNGAFLTLSAYEKGKTFCIVHDSLSADNYTNKFFPNFVKNHLIKKNCSWQIGLYPMVVRQVMADSKERPRIGIYMIPTMVDTVTKKVYDFYDVRKTSDSVFYINKKITPASATFKVPDDFIFDDGNMFP